MAEQDVLDKIEEVIGQIEELDDKLDGALVKIAEVETRVNADSLLSYACGNCGDGLVGGQGCTHCAGTGIRQHGRISKVEE